MVQNPYFRSKSKNKSLTLETNKMSSLTEEDQHQYLLEKSTDEQSFDKTDSLNAIFSSDSDEELAIAIYIK